MSNPYMNFIFIFEDSRRYPTLEPYEILNKVLLRDLLMKEEIGIYNRARPTITSILVCFPSFAIFSFWQIEKHYSNYLTFI